MTLMPEIAEAQTWSCVHIKLGQNLCLTLHFQRFQKRHVAPPNHRPDFWLACLPVRSLNHLRDIVSLIVNPKHHHSVRLQLLNGEDCQCPVIFVVVGLQDVMGVHPQLVLDRRDPCL